MTKTQEGVPRRPKSKRSRHRFTRKSVVKMLGVMSEDKDAAQDFLTTGRAGRRNAMADIMSDHATTSTSELPDKLMKCLTTKDAADCPDNSSQMMDKEEGEGSGSSSKEDLPKS